MALPKAQQLSFDDFAAPAPVRTASPVSQEPQGASKALQASTLQLHRQHNSGSLPGVATLPDLQLPPLHPGFHEDGRPRSYVEASNEWNRQLEAHFHSIAEMIAVGQADGERTGA